MILYIRRLLNSVFLLSTETSLLDRFRRHLHHLHLLCGGLVSGCEGAER